MEDTEIKKREIEHQLYADIRIDETQIAVEVTDSTVKLSGTVSSLAALQAADIAARSVQNIHNVNNMLKIKYAGDMELLTDYMVRSNIESAFKIDRNINSEWVIVAVDDGMVTLSGSVDSYWCKVHCKEVAQHVRGVLQVINGLNVVTSHDISDNQIATAIRESMKRMVGFDIENITIAVEKGIVFLTGKVPHWNAFYSAENVAKNTRGVIDVRNELLLF